MLSRRNVVAGAGALVAANAVGTNPLSAQQYPNKPLKIIVTNPPGGDDDTLTRFIVDQIQGEYGQPIIVDNRGGASTTIGARAAAQAAPDGYTLVCVHMAVMIQTVLREKLDYSMKNFTPVIGIGGYPMALVISPKSNIKTFADLKAATAKDNSTTYAAAGPGTMAHLTTERFLNAINGKGTMVPYKNNPEGLQALAGGFTEFMFPSAREGATLSTNGLINVMAVTSKARLPILPNTPTMTELGLPQIDSRLWYSFMAPAGTPPEIVKRLGDLIEKAVLSPKFKERFEPLSFQTDIQRGEALSQYVNTNLEGFRKIIVDNDIKVE